MDYRKYFTKKTLNRLGSLSSTDLRNLYQIGKASITRPELITRYSGVKGLEMKHIFSNLRQMDTEINATSTELLLNMINGFFMEPPHSKTVVLNSYS